MRDTQRGTEIQAEGEAGSCREPNEGLDPRTPGSQPEPKADTQPLSHPGALRLYNLYQNLTLVVILMCAILSYTWSNVKFAVTPRGKYQNPQFTDGEA